MKFAIAGFGKWGKNYAKAIAGIESCSLVGIHTRSFPKEIPSGVPWQRYLKQFLQMDFDTLIVATPPESHFEIACEALYQGKHVICEKPNMFTKEQFDMISREDRIFYTNYINEYFNGSEEMRNSVLNNDHSVITLSNYGNGPFRSYSSLWDYGVHEVFMAMYLNQSFTPTVKNYIKDGERHQLHLKFAKSDVYLNVGCYYPNRLNSKTVTNKDGTISWHDKKEEPLLTRMVERFNKQPTSNLEYSKAIANLIDNL